MAVLTSYARVYVDSLDAALPTFEALTAARPGLRFPYRDVELASIGGYLLVAGAPEALAPFRNVQATTIVDGLDDVLAIVEREGGEILDGPNEVPTGRNLTVRHPGGAVIEYVEFDTAKVQAQAAH
ncbi:glyoxalase/bleomycin resistance/dioxygenase family protein [Actinomadura oligospora]|uniref:glyoxalase/bleomycin resistance/dioxygenase family protein n=1 Tax=Actinomadura oligospora TaxID=111804 RepID=UPI000479E07A|nr:glyoxalase/bleomycin resistance/dioxygenase family protein [Actinomadura oligospora]